MVPARKESDSAKLATTYVSLRVLLDSLPRRGAIVAVVAMRSSEASKDKDGKTRNELHDGQTEALADNDVECGTRYPGRAPQGDRGP